MRAPELRLGQLIDNAVRHAGALPDVFGIEDEQLAAFAEAFVGTAAAPHVHRSSTGASQVASAAADLFAHYCECGAVWHVCVR